MGTDLMDESRPIRYSSGNYARWFIKEIIGQLEQGVIRQDILLRYAIRPGTLDEWVRNHASAEYRNKRKKPTVQLRNSVVRAIIAGRMTIEAAQAACNIRRSKTIRIWISDYQQRENVDLAVTNLSELGRKKTTSKATAGQQQIKVLQEQLDNEKLKVAALNTLIDVAEEQLKINIRKKPGARQF